jgi:hypothetical protein
MRSRPISPKKELPSFGASSLMTSGLEEPRTVEKR